ncbi:immunity 49 family protein [Streptomyces boninensis]|uniref:immunity 49 family protein n=1 Tax=Streptomyces boninensis TaxID=2039455 RepID=UPI003B2211E8
MASLQRMLRRLGESDMSRARALNSSVVVAMQHCLEDAEASRFQTWEAWVTAMQVGSALFDAGTAVEGPVPCRIGSAGEVVQLPATGPQPYLHVGAWLSSVYLATICRENDRLERLMRVPVDFLRASGADFGSYLYDWVKVLHDFWFRRPDAMWSSLVDAVNGTGTQAADTVNQETMLKLLYPPMALFQLYNRAEHDRFNASLTKFLTWHKQYWTADESRTQDLEGLVAIPLLAITCMAYDSDFPIDVESEYLPKGLLDRGWIGEYDT